MIFDRQINRRIKKRTCSSYMFFFSPILSLSPSICRPSRLELFLIVYHHLVSFMLLFLTLWQQQTREKKRERGRGRETEKKERESNNELSLPCSFFSYIQHHSFIIFFFLDSFSISLWLLSIKYYPEATRVKEQEQEEKEEEDETQHHTDCFDYSIKNGIKTSPTQSRYP